MSYSEFTLDKVAEVLGVTTQAAELFPGVGPLPVPPWLRETLAKGSPLALMTEKARSEFIVAPVLLTSRDLSPTPLALHSGPRFDVDPARGLVGECDFLLALGPPVPPLRAPVVTVLEAEKNDIEGGLGQCVALMVATHLFNGTRGRHGPPVHGCVTTGEAWQFLRLAGDVALIDGRRYYIDDVGTILAVFQAIIAAARGAA